MAMQRVLDALLRRLITVGRLKCTGRTAASPLTCGSPGGRAAVWTQGRRARCGGWRSTPRSRSARRTWRAGRSRSNAAIYELLDVLVANVDGCRRRDRRHAAQRRGCGRLIASSPSTIRRPRARRNAAHHYDLNGRLYSLFLDRDRQYSCAYFPRGDETIDEAQVAKKRHIAAKLLLDRPDLSVLDIGCGWGGLALTLARDYGARVTGITLSTEQLAEARARAAAGWACRPRPVRAARLPRGQPQLRPDRFGRHVRACRRRPLRDFLRRAEALPRARRRGAAARDRAERRAGRDQPRGSANTSSRAAIRRPCRKFCPRSNGRGLLDRPTSRFCGCIMPRRCARWRRRFLANRDAIASLYDERFCRMWEFYLVGSELAFRREGHMVFQMQLAARADRGAADARLHRRGRRGGEPGFSAGQVDDCVG